MGKIHWKPFRISLLALSLGGVVFVLAKLLLYPTTENPAITPFVFPTAVPLPEWEFRESVLLELSENTNVVSGRHYRYMRNQRPLDVEMRYVIRTDGEVKNLMQQYLNFEVSPGKLTLRQREGIGFYGLGATEERAYLSSCINPQGRSTVTAEQFRQNRNTYDLQFTRLLPWLLGQQTLRDFRCLWTVISIPLDNSSPGEAYPLLETVWFSWYGWWEPRFPES